MKLRSPAELGFRLRQLAANVALWLSKGMRPERPLRQVAQYREYILTLLSDVPRDELVALAGSIVAHRFPIFSTLIDTGHAIDWRRDYLSNRTSGLPYFRFVPYLDSAQVGDHKIIWELNRQQHMVVLARAFDVTGNAVYIAEIVAQLRSWRTQNPFLRGINWASALEVAFRALSWLAVLALLGDRLPAAERDALHADLYRHGRYLEHNLSVYFSPNTHLLGEALALAALGRVLDVERWQKLGDNILAAQRGVQVHSDGGYFEQSDFYHVYALDMYLLHYLLLARQDEALEALLLNMCGFLATVMGPERRLPQLGDDDGGNLFWPYGSRQQFGHAALQRAARLLSREFPGQPTALLAATGLAAVTLGDLFALVDCGPFGPGGAGHSHSDTLSMVLRYAGHDILIDAGTFTYTGDPAARNIFRGSAAHSTVRIDARDQADPVHPFRWENKPAVKIVAWETGDAQAVLIAKCEARGVVHRREIRFEPDSLLVIDRLTGPPGQHRIEQFWHTPQTPQQQGNTVHLGPATLQLSDDAAVDIQPSEYSVCYGQKAASHRIRAARNSTLPCELQARFTFRKS